jgi:hypothetical protein
MHVTGIGRPEFRRYAGIAEPLLSPVLDNSCPPCFKGRKLPAIFRRPGMGNLRALGIAYARVNMDGPANSDLHIFHIILQQGLGYAAPVAEIGCNAQLRELLKQGSRRPWREHRPRSVGFMADGDADLLFHLQCGFEKTKLVHKLHTVAGTMGYNQLRIEIGSPANLLSEGFLMGNGGDHLCNVMKLQLGKQVFEFVFQIPRRQRGFNPRVTGLCSSRQLVPVASFHAP